MSLLSRLEALENVTPGIHHPDHFVTYTVEYDEDEVAKRKAAVAEFKAAHRPKPNADIGFIVFRIIEAVDGRPRHPEWAAMR